MNIGFVSTWFERGAAYVTRQYMNSLEKGNNLFVYARGGELKAKGDPVWDKPNVTWGKDLSLTRINKAHFFKWVKKNKIEVILFNEQHEFYIVTETKKHFPQIKLGSYIDYYTQKTIPLYDIYDFIICNTKRHMEAFRNNERKYYVPWGTDIDLFKPQFEFNSNCQQTVFFHSAGMADRKGTDLVIEAFIRGKIDSKNAKLIIHTQNKLSLKYDETELNKHNIEVITKTVTAPGLYHLGDVYVYPTKLEGIGLTIFEAAACGLPVIISNNPPMNEFINNDIGQLVDIERFYSRSDGYYWPLCECNIKSLIKGMEKYLVSRDELNGLKEKVRDYAVDNFDWKKNSLKLNNIFKNTKCYPFDQKIFDEVKSYEKCLKKDALKIIFATDGILGIFLKKIAKVW